MKVLSIGNSFSCDAQRYLQRLAKKDGVEMKTVNLFIGGCSLRTHYLNMLQDAAAYVLGFNGEETGFKVSISQALASDDWDVVTVQQASHFSAKAETYFPYVQALTEYVRKYCPNAKIYVHETWAYEDDSARLANQGFATAEEMFENVEASYFQAAASIHADGIIPCGRAMLNATKLGIEKIHRDTFHAALGVGRYLLALTWYKTLTGNDISANDFDEFDVPVSDEERKIAIQAAEAAVETESKKCFAGKTFLFLGDSLTEGVRGTTSKAKGYTNVFAQMTGANVYNYGIGGTRYAFQFQPTTHKPRHDMYFATRVLDMKAEADYVIVLGGANDYLNGDAPLGQMGDTTLCTFYGAVRDLFTRLKDKYPTSKIIAITPPKYIKLQSNINAVGAERVGGIEVYAEAIKEVAAEMEIPVIDAYSTWAIDPRIDGDGEGKGHISVDRLHPNDDGHRFMAECFLNSLKNL
jgi:lysophospholipase L1-like esterase